jgi:hypothetical protein
LGTAARAGIVSPLGVLNANNNESTPGAMDSSAKLIDPIDQNNPLHPDETSVSVARRCERQ